MPGPWPAADRLALEQLKELLRRPDTPEQQDQILQLLESSPRLMAALMEQKQQQPRPLHRLQHGLRRRLLQHQQHQQQQQQQEQPKDNSNTQDSELMKE